MEVKNIHFFNDGIKFNGKAYLPDSLNSIKGTIVFTHGYGYCVRAYKEVDPSFFANNGYAFFNYDMRGHAGTKGDWSIAKAVTDLEAYFDFIFENFHYKNVANLGVFAHSVGALINLLAILEDKRVLFGSIITTITSMKDSYIYWFKSGQNIKAKEFFKSKGKINPIIDRYLDNLEGFNLFIEGKTPKEDNLDFSHRYGMLYSSCFRHFYSEIANSPDILWKVDKIFIPLIVFNNTYDEVIPSEKNDILFEKLGANKKKFIRTKGRNHFQDGCWKEIQQETVKFFDEINKTEDK